MPRRFPRKIADGHQKEIAAGSSYTLTPNTFSAATVMLAVTAKATVLVDLGNWLGWL
jgi:hypothetical protein